MMPVKPACFLTACSVALATLPAGVLAARTPVRLDTYPEGGNSASSAAFYAACGAAMVALLTAAVVTMTGSGSPKSWDKGDEEQGATGGPNDAGVPHNNKASGGGSGAPGRSPRPNPHQRPEQESFYRELRAQVLPGIRDAYLKDIRYTAKGRLSLRKWGDCWEVASKLLSGAATVLAFASAPLASGHKVVSFLSGVCGTLSLVFLLLSSYLSRQAKERNMQLNILLEMIGLDAIPDNYVNLDADQSEAALTAGGSTASLKLKPQSQASHLASPGVFPPT